MKTYKVDFVCERGISVTIEAESEAAAREAVAEAIESDFFKDDIGWGYEESYAVHAVPDAADYMINEDGEVVPWVEEVAE
jgi:hypothetical protein